MVLPPYEPEIYWKDYEITTPTFHLTSVDKPDMSPFLVHLTSQGALTGILAGEDSPGTHTGFLRSTVPEKSQPGYDAKVVCFTETPTFALDFFRYRSFTRWRNDQRFGLGFDKEALVSQGVRPVLYVESDFNRRLIALKEAIEHDEQPVENKYLAQTADVLNTLYPLLFPLLEDKQDQGFMWEREWRYPGGDGIAFDHSSIKVICCPEQEEGEIQDILGEYADGVQYVRTWREYDDMTTFIRSREHVWTFQAEQAQRETNLTQRLEYLRQCLRTYRSAVASLDEYELFVKTTIAELDRISSERNSMLVEAKRLEGEMTAIENEIMDQAPAVPSSNPNPADDV